ncbi:MAG: hypothetical protein V2A73_13835, partial [Pseudomonadota bacterium]
IKDLEFYLPGSVPLGPCSDCETNERVIPAHTNVTMIVRMDPPTWLDSTAGPEYENLAAMAPFLPPVAGTLGPIYRHCEDARVVDGMSVCIEFSLRQTVRYMTRVKIDWSLVRSSVQSRSGLVSPWVLAPNADNADTNAYVTGFFRNLNVAEDGFSPF